MAASVRFAAEVSCFLEKNLSLHTWLRKYEESSFALIRAHYKQFIKPWPHATSRQEVEHGATFRAEHTDRA